MKYAELKKKLAKAGFRFERQGKGSHQIWKHKVTGNRIVFPDHGSKEIPKGTAARIMKDAGIDQ
jgi:predicted RNA binding protein YcfA (HicA-like mRNA interferase family)